jgi:hypothetical protein
MAQVYFHCSNTQGVLVDRRGVLRFEVRLLGTLANRQKSQSHLLVSARRPRPGRGLPPCVLFGAGRICDVARSRRRDDRVRETPSETRPSLCNQARIICHLSRPPDRKSRRGDRRS